MPWENTIMKDNTNQCHIVLHINSLHAGKIDIFLLSSDFFSKSTFSKNSFTNTIRVSNSLDPD